MVLILRTVDNASLKPVFEDPTKELAEVWALSFYS
jgi:hypothetical protein